MGNTVIRKTTSCPASDAVVARPQRDETTTALPLDGQIEQSCKGQNSTTKKVLGRRGEQFAVDYLERQGVRILDRNWRCSAGEADIIVLEEDTIAFVEVKTRASLSAGLPEEAVTREKRKKYEGIAIHYLAKHSLPSSRVRFDVISITIVEANKAFLRHHRDAYCAGE